MSDGTSKSIHVLIEQEKVEQKISELADRLSKEYQGKTLHMICVLKGGVFFLTELAKRMHTDVSLDFMCVSSYGKETISSGNIKILKDLGEEIEGKDVLLVEDIIDTGRTLACLLEELKSRKPNSLKLCALLDKPARREVDVKVDYIGFTIPDVFVVGCGMDYQEKYRNLPYVGIIT